MSEVSSKKPRQEVSSDASTTDYDGDSSVSTIILEQNGQVTVTSPMGIPVDLSPKTSTPAQNRDSSDEECMYCVKYNLLILLVSLEISCPLSTITSL